MVLGARAVLLLRLGIACGKLLLLAFLLRFFLALAERRVPLGRRERSFGILCRGRRCRGRRRTFQARDVYPGRRHVAVARAAVLVDPLVLLGQRRAGEGERHGHEEDWFHGYEYNAALRAQNMRVIQKALTFDEDRKSVV